MASTKLSPNTFANIDGQDVVFKDYFEQVLTPLGTFSRKRLPLLREALARVQYEINHHDQDSISACSRVAKELRDFYDLLNYADITKSEELISRNLLIAFNKLKEFQIQSQQPIVDEQMRQKMISFIQTSNSLFKVIFTERLNKVSEEDRLFYQQQANGIGYIHWYGPDSDDETSAGGDVFSIGAGGDGAKARYALRVTSERKKRKSLVV